MTQRLDSVTSVLMVSPLKIIPSVLPADFARLGEEVVALENAGVDGIQWDIMDGRFVPNLTFGPDVVGSVRSLVEVPFEAHLMIEEPDTMIKQFVDAGCELIIVHAEATRHLHRTLSMIRDLGARSGVALNPATPAEFARGLLDMLDMVLVMTVNPGFGGQSYIASMEPKIAEVARWIAAEDRSIDLEVDGGIGVATIAGAVAAGANVLVAGTALYRDPEGLAHAVADLRARAESARTGTGHG